VEPAFSIRQLFVFDKAVLLFGLFYFPNDTKGLAEGNTAKKARARVPIAIGMSGAGIRNTTVIHF